MQVEILSLEDERVADLQERVEKAPCGQRTARKAKQKPKSSRPIVTDQDAITKDYGHALVLSDLFQGQFRYAVHRGSWTEYRNGVWRPVPEDRVAKIASDALRVHYTNQLSGAKDKNVIGRLTKAIQETCTYARIGAALSFLRGWEGVLTLADEWDAHPWLLNVVNGTLDLGSGELRPHDPDDLLTQVCRVPFDPDARGPHWEAHLKRFQPNANIRRQLQRGMGLSLVGTALEEALDIWFGGGANAKTTNARVIMGVLGDYAIRAAPSLLIQKKYDSHPTELADLAGRRLAFSVEVDDGRRLAEALVKDMTGGDRKKARFMRGDFFEFEQTFSLVLIVNHRPEIRGTDAGIWRRIRLIPWQVQIPEHEQRPQEDVMYELLNEGSAILNWMLAGLADWMEDHHWTAPEVQAATDQYRAEQDALGGFLGDMCELGPRFKVSVGDLHEAYTEFCEHAGEDPFSKKAINKLLRQRGIRQTRESRTGARQWVGLRLKRSEG